VSTKVATFAPGSKLAGLEPLFSNCDFELQRDVERIEVALAEPLEVRVDFTGRLSSEAVRCVLSTLKERGALEGIELAAVPLAHGVRVATRGALADGQGPATPLARRFDELLAHSDTAAVADVAPGGRYELWLDPQGALAFAVDLHTAAEAARAVAWLKNALALEPTGGLKGLEVAAEGARLKGRLSNPSVEQALVLRRDVLEAFRLPSGSMQPTLLPGDQFFVIKGPSARTPARGDIAVFANPREPSQDFVKRVIGLAGDHVEMDGYTVRVNGTALETKLEQADYVGLPNGSDELRGALWSESIGAHHYRVLRDASHSWIDKLDVTVEPDHVFLLGDNRDNSFDSRQFGTVPTQSLKGEVVLLWASFGEQGVNWERFGKEPD
jgi:signal peptidase I